MKSLILLCLVATGLADPLQNRRRLQSLSVHLLDDDDGNTNNGLQEREEKRQYRDSIGNDRYMQQMYDQRERADQQQRYYGRVDQRPRNAPKQQRLMEEQRLGMLKGYYNRYQNQDRSYSPQDIEDQSRGRYNPSQDRYNPTQYRYNSPQDRYNPPQERYNPSQDKYNPSEDTYNPSQDKYNPSEDRYNPSQNKYNPSQDGYNPSQYRYNTPQDRYDSTQDRYYSSQDRYYSTQGRYDSSQDRYDSTQGRYDSIQGRYDPLQNRYGLREKKEDQKYKDDDRGDDGADDATASQTGREISFARIGENNYLKSTNLDALAQQMDAVASRYGSQGRVNVAYIPPSNTKSNPYYHDLGSLNLRYLPRTAEIQSLLKPVSYFDKSAAYEMPALYPSYGSPYLPNKLRYSYLQEKGQQNEKDQEIMPPLLAKQIEKME